VSAPILEARGLAKAYRVRRSRSGPEPRWALRGVDLQVRAGETLGVVGQSGAGKSTLARLLLALEEPTAGEILFQGQVVSGRRSPALSELRRRVQIVFQDPIGSLDPRMRIGDIVAEPLRALRLPGDHRARAQEMLGAVGLAPGSARRYPHQFSGGQRQRIAIARALAPGPDVLVADEAVSGLDVSVRAQVLNLLSGLIADLGLTTVLISHDLGVVRYLCRRVLVLYQGQVVEAGSTEELYAAPRHPYTRRLLAAIPKMPGRP
jgi:ABC-type glutathione transport system ATPase component